jgi:hypothetical protein
MREIAASPVRQSAEQAPCNDNAYIVCKNYQLLFRFLMKKTLLKKC